ncbi:MAG: alpha/beta fold hydrolase [Janthinobacterium lividum]
MWLGILSGLYAIPALLVLLFSAWKTASAVRRHEQFPWPWLTLIGLILSGRWWMRLLRRHDPDEPKPLTPTCRGTAIGLGGVKLEWEQFGPDDAPAILLSHGWSLTHDTWYYQKKALSGEFRVIVWDLRGTDRSEAPADRDYSMEAMTADLAAVFETTEAGRHPSGCILAGHSVGAMLLPLFASQYPELMTQVRGLALLGGTDSPLLETMWGRQWLVPMRSWFWEPLARTMGALPAPFQGFVKLIWQMGSVHAGLMFGTNAGGESRGQDDLVAHHCADFSMRAAGLGALACFAFDARSDMPAITVPTLILTGRNDRNMPPETQQAMAGRLRCPELVLLDNCGHLALLECHAEVSTKLREFARRCLEAAR